MAGEQEPRPTKPQEDWWKEVWLQALVTGEEKMRRFRRLTRRFPSAPRCKLCHMPFGGIGGRLMKLMGYAPSRKNPQMCNTCFEKAPPGGVEVEIGVLFADVRGFTALAETKPPEEVARLLNRFYAHATEAICKHDGVIDKMVGDEVMALFLTGWTGPDYMERMVSTGEALLRGVGYGSREGPWLPLGVGVHFGLAFVGNVGAGEVKDFTALGDVVNTAARLQGEAEAGQLVMSERVYQAVSDRYPGARAVELQLKGKSEPVRAHVVEIAATR